MKPAPLTALAAALLLAWPAAAPAAGLPAGPASKDPKVAEARAHFKQGAVLYKQARYREAIAEFEIAYRLKPHGVLHFNIAQCHEKLGDIPLALRSYHQYLRETPGAEDRATVQAAMANLEKRLSEKGLQQLLIFTDPLGATVSVDGKEVGKAPWAGELAPGKHRVVLTLAGFDEAIRDVELTSRSVELDVALHRTEPAAGARAAEPPLAPLSSLVAASSLPSSTGPAPASDSPTAAPAEATRIDPSPDGTAQAQAQVERPRIWTWVVLGVAAATVGAAVGCGVSAKSSSNELLSAQHDRATAQSLHDAARRKSLAANVLYGVGAAAGVTGGVLFFAGRF